MNVLRQVVPLLAGLACAVFLSTAHAGRQGPPPPDRHEPHAVSKRHGYTWSPGYWAWNQHRYVWMGGHWLRDRPGYRYRAPQWVHHHGHWRHQPGHWYAPRDSDRDGVPNRYDRRPYDRYRY